MSEKPLLKCLFCAKPQTEVEILVVASQNHDVGICDGCVHICVQILLGREEAKAALILSKIAEAVGELNRLRASMENIQRYVESLRQLNGHLCNAVALPAERVKAPLAEDLLDKLLEEAQVAVPFQFPFEKDVERLRHDLGSTPRPGK